MFSFAIDEETSLKLLELKDAEPLFALIDKSRDYLREWLPWVDGSQTVSDTEEFIKSAMRQFASNNGFQAGIWYQDQIVGVIGFHGMSWANRSASIGYWLGEAFQGKGLMTKSCQALVKYALVDVGLNRVEIQCAAANKKSRAIPERLGFVNEGCRRQSEWLYDHFVDHIIYGMLARDWKTNK